MVLPIHLAESRQEAMRQIRDWGNEYFREYAISTTGLAQKDSPDQPLSEGTIDGMVEAGAMLIGTPDDAIAKIREMNEAAGGIGGVLNMMMDWGTREQQLRSHELMAGYVMPVFQGSADSIVYSNQWSRGQRAGLSTQYGRLAHIKTSANAAQLGNRSQLGDFAIGQNASNGNRRLVFDRLWVPFGYIKPPEDHSRMRAPWTFVL